MTIKEIIKKLRTTMDDARGEDSHFQSWLIQNEGICDAIDALKELDKQEQGQEAYIYTTPQQRTWVGLSREDCYQVREHESDDFMYGVAWAEAKLKEKNT